MLRLWNRAGKTTLYDSILFFDRFLMQVFNFYSHVSDSIIYSASLMQDIARRRIEERKASPRSFHVSSCHAFFRTLVFLLASLKLVPSDGEHQSQIRALAVVSLVSFYMIRSITRNRSTIFSELYFVFLYARLFATNNKE